MRLAVFCLLALLASCATERQLAGSPPAGAGGRGGRGGGDDDGGGRGGSAAGSPLGAPGAFGPAVLPASTLAQVLRWPGTELEIKQVAGVAAFSSDGDSRVYQPTNTVKAPKPKGRRNLDGPTICGWQGAALVIDVEPDGEGPPMEERYKLSGDGQRLVQLVLIKGGRMNGFAMSRVWDRVP